MIGDAPIGRERRAWTVAVASAAAVKRLGPTTRMRRVESLREERTCTPDGGLHPGRPRHRRWRWGSSRSTRRSASPPRRRACTRRRPDRRRSPPPSASTTARISSASVAVPSASGRPRWKRSSSRVAAIEAASAAFCCCRRSANSRPPSMTSPAMARSPVRTMAKKISVAPRSPAPGVRARQRGLLHRRDRPWPRVVVVLGGTMSVRSGLPTITMRACSVLAAGAEGADRRPGDGHLDQVAVEDDVRAARHRREPAARSGAGIGRPPRVTARGRRAAAVAAVSTAAWLGEPGTSASRYSKIPTRAPSRAPLEAELSLASMRPKCVRARIIPANKGTRGPSRPRCPAFRAAAAARSSLHHHGDVGSDRADVDERRQRRKGPAGRHRHLGAGRHGGRARCGDAGRRGSPLGTRRPAAWRSRSRCRSRPGRGTRRCPGRRTPRRPAIGRFG